MNQRPKTSGQVRAIYGEAKRRGLNNEMLHELVADVLYSTGSGSSGRAVHDALGETSNGFESSRGNEGRLAVAIRPAATAPRAVNGSAGIPAGGAQAASLQSDAPCTVSIASLSYAEAERVIQRLKGRSFVPRRTLQYRRQRAGVQQLVTHDQEVKIAALASQRNWSAGTLINFCRRQCGHYPLRTTADANKVIEGLKAMNERNGLWAA